MPHLFSSLWRKIPRTTVIVRSHGLGTVLLRGGVLIGWFCTHVHVFVLRHTAHVCTQAAEVDVTAARMTSGTFGVRVDTQARGHIVTEIIPNSSFAQRGVTPGFSLVSIGYSVCLHPHRGDC